MKINVRESIVRQRRNQKVLNKKGGAIWVGVVVEEARYDWESGERYRMDIGVESRGV